MARLPYLDKKDVPPESRDLFKRGLNLYRNLAYSPGAAHSFENFSKYLRYESKLNPRLRELAILQVGYLTRAAYSFYGHIGFVSEQFGVSDDDVGNMIAETQGKVTSLEPLVRNVLRAAREMTTNITISDSTFAELRRDMEKSHLVDLVSTIAFYNAAVRYMRTMEIDIETDRVENYEKYREIFPLPKGQ